jgi:hypothetical protein
MGCAVLLSCKKNDAANVTTTPVVDNTAFQPGSVLVVSKALNMGNPRTKLSADTVYSDINNGVTKIKPLPGGFNNAIGSFYLPVGFMVVFAENNDGTGESVCFVAAKSAITANLPDPLKNKVSFIRYLPLTGITKKGVAFTDSNAVKKFSTAWYYGWSYNRPSFAAQQYVPMTWGKGTATIANVAYLSERKDVDHLLSFNEPDNIDQSNIPVIDTAIVRYKIMMQSGLRLGSPAVTQDQAFGTGKWLTRFMDAAKLQKLRVDFMALHWYDWGNQTNNQATDSLTALAVFNRFKTYVERVHTAYPDQQIWITEFNANPNRSSLVVHKYFMKLSSDWMNTISWVERYAYFFPASVPAVDVNGAITEAGLYWNDIISPASIALNIE